MGGVAHRYPESVLALRHSLAAYHRAEEPHPQGLGGLGKIGREGQYVLHGRVKRKPVTADKKRSRATDIGGLAHHPRFAESPQEYGDPHVKSRMLAALTGMNPKVVGLFVSQRI